MRANPPPVKTSAPEALKCATSSASNPPTNAAIGVTARRVTKATTASNRGAVATAPSALVRRRVVPRRLCYATISVSPLAISAVIRVPAHSAKKVMSA